MITSRRSFLTGLVTTLAAPAIIKVADLMPIKSFDDYMAFDIETRGLHGYGVVTGRFSHYRHPLTPGIYAAMIEDARIILPRPFLRPALLELDFKVIEERVISHIEELKK